MSKLFRSLIVSVCSFALCLAPAHAGGMTGGALEVTQIMNNFQLTAQVSQQIKTVQQLVQSYYVQYNTLLEQIKSGLKIGGLSIGDIMKIKSDIEGYQNALKGLGKDLTSFSKTIDIRNVEAKLQKLTLQEYVQREQQLIQRGNAEAKARLQREITQADQIKADIALVKSLGAKIDATEGVHGATQLLNSQMNVMLQQITRLVSLTSEAQGSDKAAAIAKELNERQTARSVAEQIIANEVAQKARNKTMIDGMTAPPAN